MQNLDGNFCFSIYNIVKKLNIVFLLSRPDNQVVASKNPSHKTLPPIIMSNNHYANNVPMIRPNHAPIEMPNKDWHLNQHKQHYPHGLLNFQSSTNPGILARKSQKDEIPTVLIE